MSLPHDDPGENRERSNPTPPGPGYELYRHRDAETMRTKGWHGLFWARRTSRGDYEIRSVPTSLGEPSVPGGTMPQDGFERLYERLDH